MRHIDLNIAVCHHSHVTLKCRIKYLKNRQYTKWEKKSEGAIPFTGKKLLELGRKTSSKKWERGEGKHHPGCVGSLRATTKI